MYKVAILGLGGIVQAHIPTWKAMTDMEITACCDCNKENSAKLPGVKFYTDYKELLENEELDIVDICLPTKLHVDASLRAMEKGAHVLCEKPITMNEEEIPLLFQKAEEKNVRFMIAQVLRFWPEFCLLKKIKEDGKYGRLMSGHMFRLEPTPKSSYQNWMRDKAQSGLVPFDLHIHDLDYLIYLLGKPCDFEVKRAVDSKQDYLAVTYNFDNCFVTVESAWYAGNYPFSAGYRFQFEEAVVAFENGKVVVYEPDQIIESSEGNGFLKVAGYEISKMNGYAAEIVYFADCVRKGENPQLVPQKELADVLHILNEINLQV